MLFSSMLPALSLQRRVFGCLYYLAEIDDPFRSEGEWFANRPFQLAAFLCVCSPFIERGSGRLLCAKPMAHQRLTKRCSQPLAGRTQRMK
jgi:hypothetical protein